MKVETFGLPPCLYVPIAAASVELLEKEVGPIIQQRVSRTGRINAVMLEARAGFAPTVGVGLWEHPLAASWRERLHPRYQVWVHVDYHRYRAAWLAFGLPDPRAQFLDHVVNRRAMRLREYAHPYLRLCPVSRTVNTSGGHLHGGEGREATFMEELESYSAGIQETMWEASAIPLRVADPMDLTKMLDIVPGAVTLDGVRDTQYLFYPRR